MKLGRILTVALFITVLLTGTVSAEALKPLDVKGDIVVWYSGANESREEVYTWAKEQLESKYDCNVILEVIPQAELTKKQMTACMAGAGPDVISQGVDAARGFITQGLLLPLNDLMARAGRDPLTEFNANYFSGLIDENGQIMMIPQSRTATAMIYNKDMFREVGLDPDNPPTTREEVIEAAKLLTRDTNKDGTIDVYGIGMPANNASHVTFRLLPEIIANGGKIVSEDLKTSLIDTDATRAALEYYCSFYLDGLAPASTLSIDNNELCNMFAAGSLAIFFENPGAVYKKLVQGTEIDVGIAARPGIDGTGMSMLGGWNIGIPSSAKNPEGAAAFIDLVTSEEGFKTQLAMPTLTASIGQGRWAEDVWTTFFDIMNDPRAQANPNFISMPNCYAIFGTMVQNVMSGATNVDEAVITANEELQALCDSEAAE